MTKVYFRYHRGTLIESLDTQFEIENLQQLKDVLLKKMVGDILTILDSKEYLKVKDSIIYTKYQEHNNYDERCKQYLWILCMFLPIWRDGINEVDSIHYPIGFICCDKPELPEGFDK